MINTTKEQGLVFLEKMQKPVLSKDEIFGALFEACGIGDNVNTKHVFFQEVIIKFNASKAMTIIAKHLPYETESHFVDVAIYAYIKAGFAMRDFEIDLNLYKEKQNFIYTQFAGGTTVFANA